MPQLGFSQPFDCADYIFRFQFRFCLRLCFWDIMIICKCWHLGAYREDTGSTVAGIFSVTVTVILPVKV